MWTTDHPHVRRCWTWSMLSQLRLLAPIFHFTSSKCIFPRISRRPCLRAARLWVLSRDLSIDIIKNRNSVFNCAAPICRREKSLSFTCVLDLNHRVTCYSIIVLLLICNRWSRVLFHCGVSKPKRFLHCVRTRQWRIWPLACLVQCARRLLESTVHCSELTVSTISILFSV